MRCSYNIGEEFPTAYDLTFKGFLIPRNTLFQIIEKVDNENYKIFFNCIGNENHEECIQIMDIYEIDDMRMSAGAEY